MKGLVKLKTQIQKTYTAIRNHKPVEYIGNAYIEENNIMAAEDPVRQVMSEDQIKQSIEKTRRLMQEAAKKLDFQQAALYRDEMLQLMKLAEQ